MAKTNKQKAKALYDEMSDEMFPLYSSAQKRGFRTRARNLAKQLDTTTDDRNEQHAIMYLDAVSLRLDGDIWRA